MSRSRFIKTKSNYTLKKKHLSIDGGTIFERDYMTIIGKDAGNFKFTGNQSPYLRRKHNRTLPDEVSGGEASRPDGSRRAELKPNYNSLLDFACYGSAVELLKASVNEVIHFYPASVSSIESSAGKFAVINDYGIDLFSNMPTNKENSLRNFCESFSKYILVIKGKECAVNGWTSSIIGNGMPTLSVCEDLSVVSTANIAYESEDGTAGTLSIVRKYNRETEKWEYTSDREEYWTLRPNRDVANEEMRKLGTLSKILVSRETVPIFNATFDTPMEGDGGIIQIKKSYIWPTLDGWSPSISSAAYITYLESLYKLADFHDSRDSDNIWRSMTHESIKGMDLTFSKKDREGYITDEIDTSRIKPVLRLWGRVFDDIKRYIDGIGDMNNVSYNQKNNCPDIYLRDMLTEIGWNVREIIPSSKDTVVTDAIYPGRNKEYTKEDINYEFYRRLRLNSREIFKRKGTKISIKEMLSMFGLRYKDDYIIQEYYTLAKGDDGQDGYPKFEDVANFNRLKSSYPMDTSNPLYGLPVKRVQTVFDDGSTKDYIVPWFDSNEKYDNGAYFQMKGGWGRQDRKRVVNPLNGNVVDIRETDGISLYEETYPLINVSNSLTKFSYICGNDSMKEGDIAYIIDISDLPEKYRTEEAGQEMDCESFSHYFYLKNGNLSGNLGYNSDKKDYGWRNIPVSAFDETLWKSEESKEDDVIMAMKVAYLESLSDTTEGNNPHNGHLSYDDGRSYFTQFKDLLPDEKFNMISQEMLDMKNKAYLGFNIVPAKDAKRKTFFFKDRYDGDKFFELTDDEKNEYRELYNPESQDEAYIDDEAVANSILNTKNLSIMFKYPKMETEDENFDAEKFNEEYENFVKYKVMFYLYQVIPSTTIIRYSFYEDNNAQAKVIGKKCGKTPKAYLLGVI